MTASAYRHKLRAALTARPALFLCGLLLINFCIRVLIYHSTRLFYFSDFEIYLRGMDNIARGNRQYLLEGNYLFLLSYAGWVFRTLTGSDTAFFLFNCAAGTLTALVIYHIIVRVSGMPVAGLIAVLLLTLYTEYMVFSSVFYTPVIMLLLVSLIILLTLVLAESRNNTAALLPAFIILALFLLTFFFKPELKFLPPALIILSLLMLRRYRPAAIRLGALGVILLAGQIMLNSSGLISAPQGNVISNSFVFFGHTGYGGDGGEGTFITDDNAARYEHRFELFCRERGIVNPGTADYNAFQRGEIISFITRQPHKWIALQFRKFFRTFGIMPESNSFRVLFTGALKGMKWLTAIAIVLPVTGTVALLILLFSTGTLARLKDTRGWQHTGTGAPLTGIMLMFFIYYLAATVFYGHYQERYRMTLMTVFLMPVLAIFISTFDRKKFLNRGSLLVKGAALSLFMLMWGLQAFNIINNTERYSTEIKRLELFNKTGNLPGGVHNKE